MLPGFKWDCEGLFGRMRYFFPLFLPSPVVSTSFSLLRPVIRALQQDCLRLGKLLIRGVTRGAADRCEHRERSGKFDMGDEQSSGKRSDFWQKLPPFFLQLLIAHIVTQALDFQRGQSQLFKCLWPFFAPHLKTYHLKTAFVFMFFQLMMFPTKIILRYHFHHFEI